MPPRYQSTLLSFEEKARNLFDHFGQPAHRGHARVGAGLQVGGQEQSLIQNPTPRGETTGAAQLLVLSVTGDSIASGGDHVAFDTVVAQHGFDGVAAPSGGAWVHPVAGVYLLAYAHEWDGYEGGGTVQLELDGVVGIDGLLLSGESGTHGMAVLAYYAEAGQVGRIRVVQSSGSAQTCSATVRIAITDPSELAAETPATTCPTMGSDVSVSSVDHDAFPGLAIAADGTYVAAWAQGTTHGSSDKILRVARSSDQGATWGAAATVLSDGTYSYGNPSMQRLANGDLLLVCRRQLRTGALSPDMVIAIVSSDNGATWGPPVNIPTGFTSYGAEGFPLQLADGSILCAMYGKDSGDTNTSTKVSKSTDGGASWSALSTIADGDALGTPFNECGMVRFESTIVGLLRADTSGGAGGTYWRTASTDGGVSWSTPTQVMSNAGGYPKPCIRANGDIVVVYRELSTSAKRAVLARSSDQGATWTDCHTFTGPPAGSEMDYAQVVEDSADNKIAVLHAYQPDDFTATTYFAREV